LGPLGSDYEGQSCALAWALAVLGERWTLLIVRDAFHGLTRFDEFRRSLRLASNILNARLQKLAEHSVLERTESRGTYHLTGRAATCFQAW
jgi:DNA-binding HxlR family transcriptional regulator